MAEVVLRRREQELGPQEESLQPKGDCALYMYCSDEPLSVAQTSFKESEDKVFNDQIARLEAMAKAGAKITHLENGSVSFVVTESSMVMPRSQPITTPAPIESSAMRSQAKPMSIVPKPSITMPQATNSLQGTACRLLMDPRTGRILGTLNNPSVASAVPSSSMTNILRPMTPNQGIRQLTPVCISQIKYPLPITTLTTSVSTVPQIASSKSLAFSSTSTKAPITLTKPGNATEPTQKSKSIPTTTAKVSNVVNITDKDTNKDGSPQRKKTFPCLHVHPKPSKTVSQMASKRAELDAKVKNLLVQSAQNFTEWLIQHQLIPPKFYEQIQGSKVEMKLAFNQVNAKKNKPGGGYNWISPGSGKVISIFKDTLFDSVLCSPIVVLKLIYHWACQTNTNNIVQWVKVEQNVIDNFFSFLRGICVASLHNEVFRFGGAGKVVEIGVISLGTTTGDGSKRDVRVEVLGVLDRSTGQFRLRATEPRKPKSLDDRFTRIFEPMAIWVQKNSKIMADNSIDKEKLRSMGFKYIFNSAGKTTSLCNSQIMDYLKKVVPKMFQNSLVALETNQIQQFLDELTFRELYGYYPLMCFDNIIRRIASQTKAAQEQSQPLSERLRKVLRDPFADWRIDKLSLPKPAENFSVASTAKDSSVQSGRLSETAPKANVQNVSSSPNILSRSLSPAAATRSQVQDIVKPPIAPSTNKKNSESPVNRPKRTHSHTSDSPDSAAKRMKTSTEMVNMESYFYATLNADEGILSDQFHADMAFKCHICKKVYMNNIEFTKHLSLHLESDRDSAIDLVDLSQCKYCLRDFDTTFALQKHLENDHWQKGFSFVCKICEMGFESKNALVNHMANCHVKWEMPYKCSVCAYRSSFHRNIIDHFQETHDRTDKLQCPRCLKIFALFGDKGYNSNIASTFVSHLQTHISKQDKRTTCKKCCLSFVSDKEFKSHHEKDHVSFKNFKNVEPYAYLGNEEPIRMAKPDERIFRQANKSNNVVRPHLQPAFAAQNLEDMVMYDVESEDCGECGKKIAMKQHFGAYICCAKCRYSTCCSKAMNAHFGIFHSSSKPVFELGVPAILKQAMFCCCGFSTDSGNKMAKHLATNRCLTAYPSEQEAKKARRPVASASFAPLISLGDDDDDDVTSFDPNEVMAKAYHKEISKKAETKDKPPAEAEGPLAFLGLQQCRTTRLTSDSNIKKPQEKATFCEEMEVDDTKGSFKAERVSSKVSLKLTSSKNDKSRDFQQSVKRTKADFNEKSTDLKNKAGKESFSTKEQIRGELLSELESSANAREPVVTDTAKASLALRALI